MKQSYQKMDLMIRVNETNSVEFQPKYIQLGSNYFLQAPGKQREHGMKLVHQIDYITMREYINGIKNDDYEFYDEYPQCKEVLIMGKTSSGKSTLINALNGAYQGEGAEKVAHTAKAKGKTW